MMKILPVIILAGGYGTRLQQETETRPKPMVKIGGIPILVHIMHCYTKYGQTEFIVCGGYKWEIINQYFRDFDSDSNQFLYSHQDGHTTSKLIESLLPENKAKDLIGGSWNVAVLDTGLETTTGGRLKKAFEFIDTDEVLCTYGDGVADLDIDALIFNHRKSGKIATVTAIHPPSRFGELDINASGTVIGFAEKQLSSAYINGGFFVFNKRALDFLDPKESLEQGLLTKLSQMHELNSYIHEGFWQNMDTQREMQLLESIYQSGNAPWVRLHV